MNMFQVSQLRAKSENVQHIKFTEICVNKPGILVHSSHVLDDLQVQLPDFGVRQLSILQQRSRP